MGSEMRHKERIMSCWTGSLAGLFPFAMVHGIEYEDGDTAVSKLRVAIHREQRYGSNKVEIV